MRQRFLRREICSSCFLDPPPRTYWEKGIKGAFRGKFFAPSTEGGAQRASATIDGRMCETKRIMYISIITLLKYLRIRLSTGAEGKPQDQRELAATGGASVAPQPNTYP
jgi:hypothetical protein